MLPVSARDVVLGPIVRMLRLVKNVLQVRRVLAVSIRVSLASQDPSLMPGHPNVPLAQMASTLKVIPNASNVCRGSIVPRQQIHALLLLLAITVVVVPALTMNALLENFPQEELAYAPTAGWACIHLRPPRCAPLVSLARFSPIVMAPLDVKSAPQEHSLL